MNNDFDAVVDRVCRNVGVTFDGEFRVLNLDGRELDVVTLASVNLVSDVALTAGDIKRAVRGLIGDAARAFPDICFGLFHCAPPAAGAPSFISIDANVVVPQSFRANTLAFARENNQQAIYSCFDSRCIPTDGTGTGARLPLAPEALVYAALMLRAGRPVDFKLAAALKQERRLG